MSATLAPSPVSEPGHRALRLLLIASSCDGTDISEGAVAYQWAARLAARHDVTLLTYRKRDRVSSRDQLLGVRFIEWEEWPLVGRVASLNNLLQPSYAGFYAWARRWIIRALARGERFDMVHQLTPMALRYPSPAAGLVPRLVIGPMAGALPTPPQLRSEMAAAPWYTKLRALDQWRFRHDPMLRRSIAGASAIIGAAPYVRDVLADVPLRRFEVMSELGVAELPPPIARPVHPRGELRALFVGRVIRSKGVRDAIRAWACLGDLQYVTLDVVGDGEDRAACELEAQRLGVADRVTFHGRIPRLAVNRLYDQADVFVFPSFREPTGGVLVEAMSHGLPVVTVDYGGPADLIDDCCGIRVAVSEPRTFAEELARAIRELADDPLRCWRLGAAGRRRVEAEFLWPAKIRWLEALYNDLLGAETAAR